MLKPANEKQGGLGEGNLACLETPKTCPPGV